MWLWDALPCAPEGRLSPCCCFSLSVGLRWGGGRGSDRVGDGDDGDPDGLGPPSPCPCRALAAAQLQSGFSTTQCIPQCSTFPAGGPKEGSGSAHSGVQGSALPPPLHPHPRADPDPGVSRIPSAQRLLPQPSLPLPQFPRDGGAGPAAPGRGGGEGREGGGGRAQPRRRRR